MQVHGPHVSSKAVADWFLIWLNIGPSGKFLKIQMLGPSLSQSGILILYGCILGIMILETPQDILMCSQV